MEYEEYEKKVNEIKERNNEYLELFEKDMIKEGLSKKTISKHLWNVDFFINDFLNYYDPREMEDGCYYVSEFFGDWFIRKAMWSSCESIKNNCASLKKFYRCMNKHHFVSSERLDVLISTIKSEKEEWLDNMKEYESDIDDPWFF